MRLVIHRTLFSLFVFTLLQTSAEAQLVSPQIGWQAPLLNDLSQNVSGIVTILDEDTLRIDEFTYNGRGGAVYFYLGTVESDSAFLSGLRIGSLLSGTVFDGMQEPLFVDLPLGETLEGFNAFSVWCEAREVNFGSGTFQPVAVPEPDAFGLMVICILGLFIATKPMRRHQGTTIDSRGHSFATKFVRCGLYSKNMRKLTI